MVPIASFNDMKRATVADIRNADIVLVSSRVLVSKAYQEHFNLLTGTTSSTEEVLTATEQYQTAKRRWDTKVRSYNQSAFHHFGPGNVKVQHPGPEPKPDDFKDKTVSKAVKLNGSHMATRNARLANLVAQLLSKNDSDADRRSKSIKGSQGCKAMVDALEGPVFEMFEWRRLVVDELHEVLKVTHEVVETSTSKRPKDESRWLFHSLDTIKAESRWGLTATPNIQDACAVSHLAWFHRVFVPRDSDPEAQHYLDEYARSNDWDDSGIPMETHLITVRQTARERALYLNHANMQKPDPVKLLQLCSFFSPEGKDADADAAVVSTRLENETALQKHLGEMEKAARELSKLEQEAIADFPTAADEMERKRRRDRLKRLIDGRPAAEQKEKLLKSQVKYFEEMLRELQKLDNEEVECPVCMDKLEPSDCMVTLCGHLFCRKCIVDWVGNRGSCPTCKRRLQLTNILPAQEVLASEQESSRITMFGSKVQAVCNQLDSIWQNEPGSKVIIFVQFEVLMRKMEGALKDMGLPCMTLQGSVFDRRKTIRRFQSTGDHNRVLLLSLEKNPAGMNLVCCHHLLLVHPMQAESRVAALSFERQAIGRVRRQGQRETVHIYRFFVRDTLEEQLTREHHQELLSDELVKEDKRSSQGP